MARLAGPTQRDIVDAVMTELRASAALAELVGDRIYSMRAVPGAVAPAADKETPYLDVTIGDTTSTRNGYCDSTWFEVVFEIRFGGVVSCYDDDDEGWDAIEITEACKTIVYSSATLMRLVKQWNIGQEPALRLAREQGGAKIAVSLMSLTCTYDVRYSIGA